MEVSFGEMGIKVSAKSVLESGEIEVIASSTENAWEQLRAGLKPGAYRENRGNCFVRAAEPSWIAVVRTWKNDAQKRLPYIVKDEG